ncbi:glycosyltransferase [Bacillus sp. AFS041924]|uniref:glycosyltransferase n=1 Tax=Bacillus sp. AFS041924 TaxID=2033503 RepID=UPI000BFE3D0F|nr:glycosyltransferase [Bacillus sp. AFS041924]PGS56020.1 hypothetical protein COC46_01945 [Bacillus sp. AFS041924]
MPKVSVLMSVYNSNINLLDRALLGIERQTFKDFEVVLVNDDPQNKKLKEYLKKKSENVNFKLRILENEINSGLIYSLNKGLKLCEGEFIARADDDDFSYRERLAKQVEYLERNPKIAAVGTWVKIVNNNNESNTIRRYPVLKDIPKIIPIRCPIQHSFLMVRKGVIISNGGYEYEYPLAEDYALFLKLRVLGYELDNIQEVLGEYKFTILDANKRSSICRKSVLKAKWKFFKKDEPFQSLKGLIFASLWWIIPQDIVNHIYSKEINKSIIFSK